MMSVTCTCDHCGNTLYEMMASDAERFDSPDVVHALDLSKRQWRDFCPACAEREITRDPMLIRGRTLGRAVLAFRIGVPVLALGGVSLALWAICGGGGL